LATSELNRAILPYQSSPVDRLGRGHREEGEGVEPYEPLSRPMRTAGRWQRTEKSNLTVLPAARFPAGASRLAGSSSAEGGLFESHGVIRASASNGAQRACLVRLP
jgi:hypothetical protein